MQYQISNQCDIECFISNYFLRIFFLLQCGSKNLVLWMNKCVNDPWWWIWEHSLWEVRCAVTRIGNTAHVPRPGREAATRTSLSLDPAGGRPLPQAAHWPGPWALGAAGAGHLSSPPWWEAAESPTLSRASWSSVARVSLERCHARLSPLSAHFPRPPVCDHSEESTSFTVRH